jgi:hypothetical protein
MLTACQKAEAPAGAAAITETEASVIFDATVAVWASMDATKIKALYGSNIAGFDFAAASLVSDQAAWDKNQEGYAAMKIDAAKIVSKHIQILDAETFIVTSVTEDSSTTMPSSNGLVRCTDVYRRDEQGKWPIVNEHCSAMPKPA